MNFVLRALLRCCLPFCVAALSLPAAALFDEHPDGTVTDTVTGLMWDRCAWGQSGNNCAIGSAGETGWQHALQLVSAANAQGWKGYRDWRLPNQKELESLVDLGRVSPAIDPAAFPNAPSGYFWSATTFAPDPARAWYVSFVSGVNNVLGKTGTNHVRLVRGGGSFDRTLSVSLSEGLDAPELPWATDFLPWFGQLDASAVSGAAARSGGAVYQQPSTLRTAVTGPGTVSFRWRVSSEPEFDGLGFFVDGALQTYISGETGWQQASFAVSGGGAHTLEWRYIKDGSEDVGEDAGWLDDVLWTAQVTDHYYRNILNREPDSGGVSYWQGEIERLRSLGADPAEAYVVMANYFFLSPEFTARNMSDGQFVSNLYGTFFRREPDGAGYSYWTGQIAQGMPWDMVMYSFMFSPEFSAYMAANAGAVSARAEVYAVFDFYRGAFGRLPDTEGLKYWVNRFRMAQCLPEAERAGGVYQTAIDIAGGFFGSAEYWATPPSAELYVSDLYNAFMRRAGDLESYRWWSRQLTEGLGHDVVRQAFIDSPEFGQRVNAIVAAGCAAPMQ